MKYCFHALAVTVALAAAALPIGCDGGGATKESKGPKIEEKIEQASALQQEAEAAGADKVDPEAFEAAVKKLEAAQSLNAEGKEKPANSKVGGAIKDFKELLARAGESKKFEEEAAVSKKDADKTVAALKREKVDENAPEAFKEIESLIAAADQNLKSGVATKLFDAKRSYDRVKDMATQARKDARENKDYKAKSEEQRKLAAEAEGKAVQANAEKIALSEMTQGRRALRTGDEAAKEAKFRNAFDEFRRAEDSFNSALQQASSDLASAGNPPPAGGVAIVDVPAPEESAKKKRGKAAAAAPPDTEKPPELEEVPPEPGAISAEDEIFLVQNINKLINSGVDIVYDQTSGELTVEYLFGDQLRVDVIYPLGPIPPKQVYWKDPQLRIGSKDIKNEADKKALSHSFNANTSGMFLLPIPFRDHVTVEYRLEVGMMDSAGGMTCMTMASKDGKSYVGANFGTVEVWANGAKRGTTPPKEAAKRRSPNMWFLKDGRNMRIEYKPSDKPADAGKKSMVRILIEGQEDLEEVSASKPFPSRSGFVGFTWSRTKFNVRGLKISGKLDKQAAVQALKKKMGVKEGDGDAAPAGKSVKKSVAPKRPEQDGGESGGDGATVDGESKPKAKKPAKPKKEADETATEF